eukprot:14522054-Ditylum_brightwellii.AAC.1
MVLLGILPNVTPPFNGVSLAYVDNVYCFKSVYNKLSDNASMPPLALFNAPELEPVPPLKLPLSSIHEIKVDDDYIDADVDLSSVGSMFEAELTEDVCSVSSTDAM